MEVPAVGIKIAAAKIPAASTTLLLELEVDGLHARIVLIHVSRLRSAVVLNLIGRIGLGLPLS